MISREVNLVLRIQENLILLMDSFNKLVALEQIWNDLGLSGNVTDEDILEATGISSDELTAAITTIGALRNLLITQNHSDSINKFIIS